MPLCTFIGLAALGNYVCIPPEAQLSISKSVPPACLVHVLLSLQTYRSLLSKYPALIFDDPVVHMYIYACVYK